MQKLIILGAGTFALEVTDLVNDLGGYEIIGYAISQGGNVVTNGPIFSVADLPKFLKEARVVGAMVSTERTEFIQTVARMGFKWATLIHPSASVSKLATVLSGAVIGRQVAVGCYAMIGSYVVVNRGALIGHHTLIGQFSTIGPGANIAGLVNIEPHTMVGMGATIIERLTIGHHAVIGAGSVVLSDAKSYEKMLGNPAVAYGLV